MPQAPTAPRVAGGPPQRRRPGHLVPVANLKGGTGKSTVSVNLACALAARHGLRVALVDNDEQGSAAAWSAAGGMPARCLHLPLARAEELAGWLATVAAVRAGHDVVVVDFPAGMAPALAATLLAASLVLVPTSASGLDLAATGLMLGYLDRVRAERPDDPLPVLVVPSRVGTGPDATHNRLPAFGEELAPAVALRREHADAFAARRWTGDHAPGSAAHLEVLALAGSVAARLDATEPRPWPWAAPAPAAPCADAPLRTARPSLLAWWARATKFS